MVEYLKGDPLLQGDGGQVGSVLSPHMESLMKLVELRKKKRAGLLLLRYPVLRIAPRMSPHTRFDWERCTVLGIL